MLERVWSKGCGKARLAMQVAADLVEAYPDGIWLVELAPLADPGTAPQTVANVLGDTTETIAATLPMLKPESEAGKAKIQAVSYFTATSLEK